MPELKFDEILHAFYIVVMEMLDFMHLQMHMW